MPAGGYTMLDVKQMLGVLSLQFYNSLDKAYDESMLQLRFHFQKDHQSSFLHLKNGLPESGMAGCIRGNNKPCQIYGWSFF